MRGRHIRFILLLLAVSSGHGQLRASNPAGPDSPTKIAVQQWAHEPRGAERCAGCHSAEVEGYARSAMAHSLRRAAQEPAGTVTTPDSTITMSSSPKGSWQRLQTGRGATGSVTNYRVDYVIGSGNHASGYLVNIAGHLFQSPVAFYKSRNAYDLAPGYEKTQDPDFTRPIAEGCVFCHAGTELHIRGTDNQYRSPAFSAEAITCERCHGPSEKHLADPKAGTIVNPAKLEPGARDSICEQCHLMGVTRVLNPGKEFRDFQPGQRLETTFTTYHDTLPPNAAPGSFKVISHVEQLAMSVCAKSSQGKLWCGTCHDPHNKPEQPVAYYRSRCLTCHTGKFPGAHPAADSNCIGCHMPRRDAQDGGHTAFTDHRIQRQPEAQPNTPPAGDIAAWREPPAALEKRNLGIALISAGLQRRSADLIVRGYRSLTEVQTEFSSDPDVFTSMGTALLIGKQASEAEFAFERALQLHPDSATAETNVAAAHQQAGDIEGTVAHLERAVADDPMHLPAITALINLYQQQGNTAKAGALGERVRAAMEEASHAPSAADSVSSGQRADAIFKNLKILKDLPSDQIIPGMRFISSSLGVQCGFCHVEGHFDDDTKKEKQIAGSMMQMMASINQNRFDGAREVTCYSCHRGAPKPVADALIPVDNSRPNTESTPTAGLPSDLPTSDQLVDHFIRALGGAAAIAQMTTRTETGGEVIDGKSVRIELVDKGPDKQLFVEHMSAGDRVTTLNGDSGWVSVPGRPTRDLSGFGLEAGRMNADLQFALHIRQNFPDLRVEYPEAIEGREVYVMTGAREGRPAWKFYFDFETGLLMRVVGYDESPFGLDPTQIDYSDYRAVDGVQIPFAWTIARAGDRSTVRIDEVRQNVPIDDGRFAKPAAK